MSQVDATQAVNELRDLVLANPELSEIAKNAKTMEEFSALWNSEAFREAHDRLVNNVSEQDIRDHLSELSDEDLDHVAGGFAGAPSMPKLKGRALYVQALSRSLPDSFFDIDVECRGIVSCRI